MSTPPGSSDPLPLPSFVPPSPEELGTLLPQYEISHLIAAGGMGAVFAGLQRALDRPVAIKVLPPDAARDGESIGRFRTEAKAMARLIHPNIPAVYDFDVSGGYCYLVMEFIDGSNVHQLITGKELAPDLTYRLLSQVCDALHFAHQRGIVHGDIKPSNILVTQDGIVKLADFGLAQLAGTRESEKFAPMGTPEYAAPELWQPGVVMDHRADLYSLGCVFYEMLTGAPPQGQFQLPAAALKLDPRVDAVIARCMQQKPELRYQSAAEAKLALDAILQTPAPAPAPAKHAVRKVRPPNPKPPLPKPPAARSSGPAHSPGPAISSIPRQRGKKISDSPLPWVIAVGIAIAAVMYAFNQGGKSTPPPAPPTATETPTPPPAQTPTPAPAKVKDTSPAPAPTVASPPKQPVTPVAPPPPVPTPALSPEASEKISTFRAKYRNEWQITVTEKRNAERERLSSLYHTALDKFRQESANSGDAAALLAVRNEADRFNRTPTGVPDSQLSPIEKLATLQKTLTTSFANAETRLKPAIDQLRERCLLELKQIEAAAASGDQELIGALYDKIVAAPDLESVLAD